MSSRSSRITFYLLSFPIAFMGVVQAVFAFFSLFYFHDHEVRGFVYPALVQLFVAYLFSRSDRTDVSRIDFRDSLLFAALTWGLVGFLGAWPIYLITGVSMTDAVFESLSALTTTGATILAGLDDMPLTFLMYRQFLQWMGGLGVVIFVVAVLPMLNVGGMRLLKAETPGPVKDDKLSPRIANTAHHLWFVYVTLTIMCIIAYRFAGMSLYDAIAHSFATVSTGGFSTHDASLGYFGSPLILMISDVFMLLGAISFATHFRVGRHRRLGLYWKDEETRVFLKIIAVLGLVIALSLFKDGVYASFAECLNMAFFHLISFITSTGFGAADFAHWPIAVTFMLVFAGYLGGCSGSTAGGNKIVRNILSIKLIGLQFRRLIHPQGYFTVRYQQREVDVSVLSATIAFMSVAASSSLAITFALMMTGLDFWSAITGVAACLNVLGPAFGELGSNFQPLSDTGTWILSLTMILGRLEYFTVLALLLPGFWRH